MAVIVGVVPGTSGVGTDLNALHLTDADELSQLVLKAAPVSGDVILIEDSEDSQTKKKIQIGSLSTTNVKDDIEALVLIDVGTPASDDKILLKDTSTGELREASFSEFLSGGNVESVNGEGGAVVLDADDISDTSTTNKFVTSGDVSKLSYITITQPVNLDSIETMVAGLTAAVTLQGEWDASAGTFPGSGSAALGDSYIVTTAGTVDSVSFAVNDRIVALTANASTSTYASNWLKLDYSDVVASVNGATGTVVLDPDDLDDTSTTNKFTTAADITKLSGIETAADVTDSANVKSAIDGMTVSDVGTIASDDQLLVKDTSDSGNLKGVDYSDISRGITAVANKIIDYTLLPTDTSNLIEMDSSSTLILFLDSVANTFTVGDKFKVYQKGTGSVNFISKTGTTLLLPSGKSNTLDTQNEVVEITYVGNNNFLLEGAFEDGAYTAIEITPVDFTTTSTLPDWMTFTRGSKVAYIIEDGSSVATVDLKNADEPRIDSDGLHLESVQYNWMEHGTMATWDVIGSSTITGGEADPSGADGAELVVTPASSQNFTDSGTIVDGGGYVYGALLRSSSGVVGSNTTYARENGGDTTVYTPGTDSSAFDISDSSWRLYEYSFTKDADANTFSVTTQWPANSTFYAYLPFICKSGYDYVPVHDGVVGTTSTPIATAAASVTSLFNADRDYTITHTPEGGSQTTTTWTSGTSFPSIAAGTIQSITYGTADDIWDGLDEDIYRGGSPVARVRSITDVITASTSGVSVINVGSGAQSASSVKALIDAESTSTPVLVQFNDSILDGPLLIERGNITLAGKVYRDVDKSSVQPLIQIVGPGINNNQSSPTRFQFNPSASDVTLIGQVDAAFSRGDTTITLTTASGLSVGDFVQFYKLTPSLNTYSPWRTSIMHTAKITAISGADITLETPMSCGSTNLESPETIADIDVYKYDTDLLENVSLNGLQWEDVIDSTALENPNNYAVLDYSNTQDNYYPYYAAGNTGVNANYITIGQHYMVVVAGCYEPNILSCRGDDAGSTHLFLSCISKGHLDGLICDGTYNKGNGGNGYGLELFSVHYSDMINLEFYNLRHGFTTKDVGQSSFNKVHIKQATSNSDFHGGRDEANVVYIAQYDAEALWNTTGTQHEINFTAGMFAFGAFEYRYDASSNNTTDHNQADNIVRFGTANGLGANTTKTTSNPFEYHIASGALAGKKINETLNNMDDKYICVDDGSTINAGVGDDTITGGIGDDTVHMGVPAINPTNGAVISSAQGCRSVFYVKANGGDDTLNGFITGTVVSGANFGEPIHRIQLDSDLNSSGITTPALALAACTDSGANVVLDLGSSNTVTITNVQVADLVAANFVIV